jgi:aminoglycoside phosphotransferase (APT) family kinase protein
MDADPIETPQRSTRSREGLRERLRAWLAGRLLPGSEPELSELVSPSASGMSSETLLFEATWQEGGAPCSGSFVARVQPDVADVPVFPVYDLASQFRLLRLVAQQSDVPVPRVRWLELDPAHLGAPFFVMDRALGRVPPDVMPYVMGSWLQEASPAEQRRLQDASVGVLASLHAIDPVAAKADFLELAGPGTPLRRHVAAWRRYYDWVRGERTHRLIERAFVWLDANWPADEGPTVISWGDSRIGNVMYDGFEPAAVLDWEMAALGPRELDLGWMTFMHLFFHDLARQMNLPGMPDFLLPEDAAATYARLTGHTPTNLRFHELYAALRHAIIMSRIHARRVHFGEAEWEEDLDALIPHRGVLQKMIEGRNPREG